MRVPDTLFHPHQLLLPYKTSSSTPHPFRVPCLGGLPQAPIPAALDVDLSHKDDAVDSCTVRDAVGRSVLRMKCPMRTFSVVGDSKSFALFQHIGQHTRPVQFLTALRHLNYQSDEPVVNQVE